VEAAFEHGLETAGRIAVERIEKHRRTMGVVAARTVAQHDVRLPAVLDDQVQLRLLPLDPVGALGVAYARRMRAVRVDADLAIYLAKEEWKLLEVIDQPILVPTLEQSVLWVANDIPRVAGEVEQLLPRPISADQRAVELLLGRMVPPREILRTGDHEVVEEELPSRSNLEKTRVKHMTTPYHHGSMNGDDNSCVTSADERSVNIRQ